jgi:hypothetical protein
VPGAAFPRQFLGVIFRRQFPEGGLIVSEVNGKGGGHGDEALDAQDEADVEWSPAPPHVVELSASCARFVLTKYRVPLDGTSDTLSLLDQYVKDARAELAVKPEALDLLSATIGAYLGEVMRRAFGGVWFAEGDYDAWRIDATRVFLTFNPIGMAREALAGEEQEGWHAHLEMDQAEREEVERRLQALGEVEQEEYFLPSTRYDVVALAVETLRAKMVADGHGDVTFGPEDYRRK